MNPEIQQCFGLDVVDCDVQQLQSAGCWQVRYQRLMALGDQVCHKEALRCEQFLVQGCEAKTWLAHRSSYNSSSYNSSFYNCSSYNNSSCDFPCDEANDQKHYFALDSDSRIVRGLGALMLSWYEGQKTQVIMQHDWQQTCRSLGLQRHLSASRANGFRALVEAARSHVT